MTYRALLAIPAILLALPAYCNQPETALYTSAKQLVAGEGHLLVMAINIRNGTASKEQAVTITKTCSGVVTQKVMRPRFGFAATTFKAGLTAGRCEIAVGDEALPVLVISAPPQSIRVQEHSCNSTGECTLNTHLIEDRFGNTITDGALAKLSIWHGENLLLQRSVFVQHGRISASWQQLANVTTTARIDIGNTSNQSNPT